MIEIYLLLTLLCVSNCQFLSSRRICIHFLYLETFHDIAANVLHSVDNEPTITPDIGLLSESIEKLNLRNNFIGGTIPTSIGSLILLKEFDVSYNKLRGSLPDSLLQNATGLEVVRVGHNLLNGTIPELRLAQLKELRLSFNGFTGDISKVFGDYPKLGTCRRIRISKFHLLHLSMIENSCILYSKC